MFQAADCLLAQQGRRLTLAAIVVAAIANTSQAQLAPTIGYVYPSGGPVGQTVEVTLGGYDWTPDMQLFVHDERIKLELVGSPSAVLVPEPPYWFGAKARGPAWPLPREFKARLTIPADVAPGLISWQAANANGASPLGTFQVGAAREIVEVADRKTPQPLGELPVTVNGQIRLIEEVDRYEFQVPQAGPVTIETVARRLGSPLHAMLQVRDERGAVLVDAADTEGRDLAVTFAAEANKKYTVSLHDLDFAGDRSYVYRLSVTRGPRVVAAFPSAGRAGETRSVEFLGVGVATGAAQLESVRRDVTFAGTSEKPMSYVLATPHGSAPACPLVVSKLAELIEPTGAETMTLAELPIGVTGALEKRFGADRYTVTLKKDDAWRISASSRALGAPLDLELAVVGPDGKEVATNDDVPGTTDATLAFKPPADAQYTIVVSDRSGKSGSRAACYRLSIERAREDFALTTPAPTSIALGAKAKLTFTATRGGDFKGPIQLALAGLPKGVTTPAELLIAADKNELAIELECAATAPANAALVKISATATLDKQPVTRAIGAVLLATVMKPRIKITPEGLDDVRKVHRGSTYLAPLLIERLEGYKGPITLEMTALQQRHRQGLACDEFVVPPDAKRVEPPMFIPEWMETTKTSRMILNGVVKVADPTGVERTLVQKMELRIGILPEGALMKLAHAPNEYGATSGGELTIPLSLSRAAEFHESAKLEFVPRADQIGKITAEPTTMTALGMTTAPVVVRFAKDAKLEGEQSLLFRATALKDGRWPVVTETTVPVVMRVAP